MCCVCVCVVCVHRSASRRRIWLGSISCWGWALERFRCNWAAWMVLWWFMRITWTQNACRVHDASWIYLVSRFLQITLRLKKFYFVSSFQGERMFYPWSPGDRRDVWWVNVRLIVCFSTKLNSWTVNTEASATCNALLVLSFATLIIDVILWGKVYGCLCFLYF